MFVSLASVSIEVLTRELPQVWTIQEELASAMIALRSALNAAIPFHRLPIELVKGILALVPTMTYRLPGQRKQIPIADIWQQRHIANMGELCTLMLVCRQWRDIIIGIQPLWNIVDQMFPQTETKFFKRARAGPLRIVLRNVPSAFMSSLCSTEGARIVHLHHIGVFGAMAEEHLSFPAPSLEVLHLTNDWLFGRLPPAESKQTVQLFGGNTPRLRQLSLHNVRWFPDLRTDALTHLDVHMCHWDDFLVKIMGILASAPNLTDVVLSCLSSTVSEVASLHAQYYDASVSLPRLRRLHLRYVHSEEAVIALLSKLVFPPTTALDISKAALQARFFSEEILPTLARVPVMQAACRTSISITSLPLELEAPPGPPSATIGQLVAASTQSAVVCRPLFLPAGITTLAPVLPVAQIRELWLTTISTHMDEEVVSMMIPFNPAVQSPPVLEIDAGTLRDFLQPMGGALEKLVVGGNTLPKILEALISNGAAGVAPRSLCPRLSTLGLILSTHSPPVQELMSLVAAQQYILQLKHIQVYYLWAYDGPRPQSLPQLDCRFVSVEYASRDAFPAMTLPAVCTEEAHARWTPWKADGDGMYTPEDGETRGNSYGELQG